MNIIPWKSRRESNREPSRELSALRSEMDSLFDRFFRDPWGDSLLGRTEEWMPSLDVVESESDLSLKVEVPGVDPKHLDISISGTLLTIQGEKSEESKKAEGDYYHSERRFGSFRRSIELPPTVDTESVQAEQKNGVLTITLKKTKQNGSRKIAVQAAS